jgi:hypothetical protein
MLVLVFQHDEHLLQHHQHYQLLRLIRRRDWLFVSGRP